VPDQGTSGRVSPSTARDDAAKALREELRTDFERALVRHSAKCFERGNVARRNISVQSVVVESALRLRTNLDEGLATWRATFRKPFQRHAQSLSEINPEIGWIATQLASARTTLEERSWFWLMVSCDGEIKADGWRAPGWMEGWPRAVSSAAFLMAEQLNEEQTLGVLKAFGERVGKSLTLAQESARNHAQILIAKRAAHSRKARAPRRRTTLKREQIVIALLKGAYPAISDVCKQLDRRRVAVPVPWKNAGMTSWFEAWREPTFRGRVKSHISKVPPATKD
jgi:hypothetical protein